MTAFLPYNHLTVQSSRKSAGNFSHIILQKEITISVTDPWPKGYAFLRKGDRYKTLHCRKMTHASGRALYVVMSPTKTQLGLRAPSSIIQKVAAQAKATSSTRRAAVQKRDAATILQAEKMLLAQYPRIPEADKSLVLKHSFKKNSGRVGRTGTLKWDKKVQLAVSAHIRHRHTKYDDLLKNGVEREEARKMIRDEALKLSRKWGCR